MIWGEGGAGKTSIACQIARWAMTDDPEYRPAPHRMLPVLIERELDFDVPEGRDAFTETVRSDLETLIGGESIGDDLLAALFRRRRVLVIVDHLSELSEQTRQRVRPDVPNFPASALIVTSRLEERLGDVPNNALQPLRVTGEYLSEFMGSYLRARGVREQFPDQEFFQAGGRIAEIVGDRDVTVLLVKLYLDRLIATKEEGRDLDREMPASIPSLMLGYLNDINRAVPEEDRHEHRAVHRDAKALAWACLEESFRPAPAQIDSTVKSALSQADSDGVDERLQYLERRLRIIQTIEPEQDKVRFTLDPVAEYLAGLHVVDRYAANDEAWREFLARADAMSGGLEAIRGFLLAVRDCCLTKQNETNVPDFVPDELAKRAGLDLEQLKTTRLKARIARYIAQLSGPDPDDRLVATQVLADIGREAAPAVPALMEALRDANANLRRSAAHALGQIGAEAAQAIPALIEALRDTEPGVREATAWALGGLGPEAAAAVPALEEAIKDADPNVGASAAEALAEIGPEAVPTLARALRQELGIREGVAWALGQIGPEAVPALAEALRDAEPDVRANAAWALSKIGSAALPALTDALKDAEPAVRIVAAYALGLSGSEAAAAVPALIEALSDADGGVRLSAARALGQIGPEAAPAVSALRDASSHSDRESRVAATEALKQIGTHSDH